MQWLLNGEMINAAQLVEAFAGSPDLQDITMLAPGRTLRGGGGAQPEWSITRMESEKLDVPAVVQFAAAPSGNRGCAFHPTERLTVNVSGWGEEDNEPVFETACRLSRAATEVAHLTEQLQATRGRLAECHSTITQLDGSAAKPSLLGEAVARERGGEVWLLACAEKGWSAFGYRFSSWKELAKERPDIRPCGAGADEDGPYIRMQSVSALRSASKGGTP